MLAIAGLAVADKSFNHHNETLRCGNNSTIPHDHNGTWVDLAPIASGPRQEHVSFFIPPATIGILGGVLPPTFDTTNEMDLYDITTNTWRTGAPLPLVINHGNAVTVNGKVYVLGGLSPNASGVWVAEGNCYLYDPTADAWSSLPPMPAGTERGSTANGVHNGVVYQAGGMTVLDLSPGGIQNSLTNVTAYDTVSGQWLDLPAAARYLPAPRDHVGGVVIGHTFYVLGGRDNGQFNVRDTVFALDLTKLEDGWVTKAARMPTARGGLVAAAVGRKVYTFGGEGNTDEGSRGVFNNTEVYNTETDSWEELVAMTVPRHGTSGVAVKGAVFIPGGGVQSGGDPTDYFDMFLV
ncbi:hypothetical protein B0T17DRAFT_589889 [Bombardia bombarda]|uniref:Galactose oxidase n=1 Tax=Bombardia bombarda TaxID=252184 RepID=A0AA40CAC2_9PEZI|nr:hypothetical protein B0T17DRAFT_589889 [Bombardia bombarda]